MIPVSEGHTKETKTFADLGKTAFIKQIFHNENIHLHSLASDGVVEADLEEPVYLREDRRPLTLESLASVVKVGGCKLRESVHLVTSNLFRNESVVYKIQAYEINTHRERPCLDLTSTFEER